LLNHIYSYLGSKLQSSYEKYEEKHQNSKTNYGFEAFPKTIYSSSILSKKLMLHNDFLFCQKSSL
jgi:hypothetical protein